MRSQRRGGFRCLPSCGTIVILVAADIFLFTVNSGILFLNLGSAFCAKYRPREHAAATRCTNDRLFLPTMAFLNVALKILINIALGANHAVSGNLVRSQRRGGFRCLPFCGTIVILVAANIVLFTVDNKFFDVATCTTTNVSLSGVPCHNHSTWTTTNTYGSTRSGQSVVGAAAAVVFFSGILLRDNRSKNHDPTFHDELGED